MALRNGTSTALMTGHETIHSFENLLKSDFETSSCAYYLLNNTPYYLIPDGGAETKQYLGAGGFTGRQELGNGFFFLRHVYRMLVADKRIPPVARTSFRSFSEPT